MSGYMAFSDEIRKARHGAAANPYQGKDKKVLFVCSMGILRSATAARLYADKYNTRAAGTYSDALVPLSTILLEWADEIVFVSKENYEYALRNKDWTDLLNESIVTVLSIPDKYEHMHPELVKSFEEQYEELDENK